MSSFPRLPFFACSSRSCPGDSDSEVDLDQLLTEDEEDTPQHHPQHLLDERVESSVVQTTTSASSSSEDKRSPPQKAGIPGEHDERVTILNDESSFLSSPALAEQQLQQPNAEDERIRASTTINKVENVRKTTRPANASTYYEVEEQVHEDSSSPSPLLLLGDEIEKIHEDKTSTKKDRKMKATEERNAHEEILNDGVEMWINFRGISGARLNGETAGPVVWKGPPTSVRLRRRTYNEAPGGAGVAARGLLQHHGVITSSISLSGTSSAGVGSALVQATRGTTLDGSRFTNGDRHVEDPHANDPFYGWAWEIGAREHGDHLDYPRQEAWINAFRAQLVGNNGIHVDARGNNAGARSRQLHRAERVSRGSADDNLKKKADWQLREILVQELKLSFKKGKEKRDELQERCGELKKRTGDYLASSQINWADCLVDVMRWDYVDTILQEAVQAEEQGAERTSEGNSFSCSSRSSSNPHFPVAPHLDEERNNRDSAEADIVAVQGDVLKEQDVDLSEVFLKRKFQIGDLEKAFQCVAPFNTFCARHEALLEKLYAEILWRPDDSRFSDGTPIPEDLRCFKRIDDSKKAVLDFFVGDLDGDDIVFHGDLLQENYTLEELWQRHRNHPDPSTHGEPLPVTVVLNDDLASLLSESDKKRLGERGTEHSQGGRARARDGWARGDDGWRLYRAYKRLADRHAQA